jgi:hypothetical protein
VGGIIVYFWDPQIIQCRFVRLCIFIILPGIDGV